MTDGEALLAAIISNPDDDTPRLLYADWLDETGEHERAEFIRVQVELARLPEGDGDSRLELRASKLLDLHSDEWVGPLREWVVGYSFDRGFVDWVEVEPRSFLSHADDLFRLAPRGHVCIRATDDDMPALAASPHLARVKSLGLRGIGDAGVELLARSPGVAGLEELDLFCNFHSPAAAESLARSPYLGGLVALRVGTNALGDAGLAALAGSAALPGLVTLDVASNDVGQAGLEALAGSPVAAGLRTLRLGHNRIGPGMEALAASTPLGKRSRLADLSLLGCGIGDDGARRLALAPWAGSLRRLNLMGNDIGDGGAAALAASGALAGLTSLRMRMNWLSETVRHALRERFGAAVQL